MNRIPRIAIAMSIAVAAFLCVAVCRQGLIPTLPTVSAAVAGAQDQAPPDQGPDPAAVNEAPAGPSYTTEAPPPPDQSAAPGQPPDDSAYAGLPTEQATEPPPPLPDYDQPPAPGDGYLWQPGYWAWGPNGYYWVPGAWVEPPYMGALWTPGYWGFYGGSYLFYPGHWGPHIGFYGGINYGFGYVGFGYEGGYWNGGHFFYNRAYNNINVRVVHNVYSYNAGNRGNNNYNNNRNNNNNYNNNNRNNNNRNNNNNSRPSFRGGAGVQYRPQPSEGAAAREPTAPRMNTQVQHEQNYGGVRGQFANQNHGQPATPAVNRPIPADRNTKPASHGSSGGKGGQHH
ncbi:MAG: hypothetical protein ABR865_00220 [Terracidiphilus sp.]|jgi:hypothetical protein